MMSLKSGSELAVACWAAWAPGLPDRMSWQAWAEGRKEISGPVDPDVSFVKPLLRRRLSPLSRMAFHVASACLPEGQAPFCIFCSRYGEYARAFEILNALETGEAVSPNAFSLSVHNTVSSLFSIARGDRTHSTAIAAGGSTLEAGFVEATGLLAEAPNGSALLVYYDEPLPSLYEGKADPMEVSAALALLLTLPGRAKLGEMVLRLSWGASEREQSAPAAAVHPALRLAKLLTGVEPQHEIDDGRLSWTWSRHDAAA
jgi:hypothetical protein